ncbi:ATP-binding cassette domain-containing protein, partial [Bombilactobacillus mellifer]
RGEVYIDGENIMRLNKKQLRQLRQQKISMVFQNFALFPNMTVLENAGYGLEVQGLDAQTRNKKAHAALELVHLHGYDDQYPNQLSGGMQQR